MWKQQNKSTTISEFYQGDNIFKELNDSLFGKIKKIFEQDNIFKELDDSLFGKIRKIFKQVFTDNTEKNYQLPKVIVIGTESSGKSSLLERITKCQLFPRDGKICTKCPIKVKLQNGKPSYSIQLPNDTIQQLENKKDIYLIVQNYMNSLSNDFISENEIIINITDIDVLDFEFYDLPGIRTYPPKVAKLSVNICKKYLSDKNSIVLCVVPCTTTRLTSCQSIALITEAKMEHQTILALTMTDRLQAENIEELLINRIIYKTNELNGIKFANCLAVVNRTHSDNYSLDESDHREKEWFDKNIYQCIPNEYEEFREQIIMNTSILNLLKNMDNLYNHFIQTNWIPRMINEMHSKEDIIKKELESLKSVITKDNFSEFKSCLLDFKSGYTIFKHVKHTDGTYHQLLQDISIPNKCINNINGYTMEVKPIMPCRFFESVTLYIPIDNDDELVFNIIGSVPHDNNKILEKLNGFLAFDGGYIGDFRKSINIYETIFSNFYDKIKVKHVLKNDIFNIPVKPFINLSTKFDELFLDYIKHVYNKNVLKIIKKNLIDYLLMPAIKNPIYCHNIYKHIISSFDLFNNLFLSFMGESWRETNDFIVQNITIDFFAVSDEKILELENELKNIQSNTEIINKIKKNNNSEFKVLTHLTFLGEFNQRIVAGSLPNSLTHLTFIWEFNQPIVAGSLPNSLTHLEFGSFFNKPIVAGSLPNSLTHLEFGSNFNKPIVAGSLPNSLTHLTFGRSFNQQIVTGSLPNSLTHLEFNDDFNQPIVVGSLPNSLTHLTFGNKFNQPIVDRFLPYNLTHLTFGYEFNQQIFGRYLPYRLTHLTFGYKFNKQFYNFSTNLTHLTFGKSFNQPIVDGSLPNSLTHLEFGKSFNQPIVNGTLPDSITHLTFGYEFNQPIVARNLPFWITHLTFGYEFNQPIVARTLKSLNRLTHLTFGYKFNQPIQPIVADRFITSILPCSLTHLTFGYNFNQPIVVGSLPNSLTHLTFGNNFNQPIVARTLPNNLTHLTFGSFNQPIVAGSLPNRLTHLNMYEFNQPIVAGSLPNSLTHLTMYNFNQPIVAGSLPNRLTHLTMYEFNQPIVTGSLPNSLTHLTMDNFNQPIVAGSLPNSLTHLDFETNFNQPIVDGSLPNSLTHLTFGYEFNQPIVDGSLPNSLTHLTFGNEFNQPIVAGSLPNSLTHLTFGHEFNQPIVDGSLPNSLTHLTFETNFNQPIINIPRTITHLTIGMCYF
jgi:GTPase SAR1 family protein